MHDQNFHEIQLSGKQLLFGFISAVVLLVVIFLLGVSVGRGVRSQPPADANATAPAPGDTVVATTPPPAATPGPEDLNYEQKLKGTPTAGGTTAPPPAPPASEAQKTTDPVAPATDPSKTAAALPKTAVDAAKSGGNPPATNPAPTPTTPPKPPPPASGVWFAQAGAFSTRRAAESVTNELNAKGFKAAISPSGKYFRVRVGPFATEAEAERESARLTKAGHKSSVIR